MNQTDVQALRNAVEGIVAGILAALPGAAKQINQTAKEIRNMNQNNLIEKQIVAELQKQGADSGTANVAARHAMSIYAANSRMGTASMQQVLKSAGEYAERTQKGFKFRATTRR